MRDRQIQMGIWTHSLTITEDQTVPTKKIQLCGRNNLAKYKVLFLICG